MREQNLQIVREACIKANQEMKGFCAIHSIMIGATSRKERETCKNCEKAGRPIRLADVLLAMLERYYVYRVGDKAFFGSTQKDISLGMDFKGWNLRNDDLDAQSDDCLQFLVELLNEA